MYQYTGCGLPGVWLRNGYRIKKTHYGEAVAIDDIDGLHQAIGLYIVNHKPYLTAAEIRFLRKEMDMSQAQLAHCLGVGESSLRHWESNRGRIQKPVERMLRVLYQGHADPDSNLRALIDRICQLNREKFEFELQMVEADGSWHAEAA